MSWRVVCTSAKWTLLPYRLWAIELRQFRSEGYTPVLAPFTITPACNPQGLHYYLKIAFLLLQGVGPPLWIFYGPMNRHWHLDTELRMWLSMRGETRRGGPDEAVELGDISRENNDGVKVGCPSLPVLSLVWGVFKIMSSITLRPPRDNGLSLTAIILYLLLIMVICSLVGTTSWGQSILYSSTRYSFMPPTPSHALSERPSPEGSNYNLLPGTDVVPKVLYSTNLGRGKVPQTTGGRGR